MGRGQAGTRHLMWEETWAVLGVGAWLSVQQENDRKQKCYMWGLCSSKVGFRAGHPGEQSKDYILGRVWGGLDDQAKMTEPGSLFWLRLLKGPVCRSSKVSCAEPAAFQRSPIQLLKEHAGKLPMETWAWIVEWSFMPSLLTVAPLSGCSPFPLRVLRVFCSQQPQVA